MLRPMVVNKINALYQKVSMKMTKYYMVSKVIGYASAIFCATGGALGEMFSMVVSDTGYTADMDFHGGSKLSKLFFKPTIA